MKGGINYQSPFKLNGKRFPSPSQILVQNVSRFPSKNPKMLKT